MEGPPRKKPKLAEVDSDSEKPANSNESTFSNVSCIYQDPSSDQIPPFVMCFPQGPPPTGILNNGENGIRITAYKPKNSKESTDRIDLKAIATDFPVQYQGTTDQEDETGDGSKYWIGVYNRKTNKVQIVPTPDLFNMNQTVLGQDNAVVDRKYADLDYIAQRSMLINTFASTRRRKMLTTMVSNRVNDQTSFGVEVIDVDEQHLDMSNLNERRPELPEFDASATTSDAIYPFEKLAPVDIIDFLISTQTPCVKCLTDSEEMSAISSNILPSTLMLLQHLVGQMNAMRAASSNDSLEIIERRAAMLQYLVYLMTIFRIQGTNHHKVIRTSAEKQGIPSTALDSILNTFASSIPGDRKKFILSSTEQSKLLTHIAIIALSLNNFSISINQIATDLSITVANLRTHFELAGCKVAQVKEENVPKSGEDKTAGIYVAKLSAPLVLPNPAKRTIKSKK